MPRRLAVFAVASFAALMSLPSSAQSMKPGLWEIHNKIGAENGELARQMEQMQKQLASMPPEQRKMMEEMMAKHGGAGMPTVKDGGMVVKVCVSKEMVAQNQVPVQQQGNCTNTRSPITGGTMKMSFVCTKPDSSGEGEIQFMGDTGYRMKMKMKSVVKGKPETMSMDATGKFMGSDCGAIKPMAMPMPPQK